MYTCITLGEEEVDEGGKEKKAQDIEEKEKDMILLEILSPYKRRGAGRREKRLLKPLKGMTEGAGDEFTRHE